MLKKLFDFSEKNNKNRAVIAHAHIFKNAGSTIDWILQKNFGRNFLDDRNDELIRSDCEYITKLLNKNKLLKAFSSHSLPLPIRQIDGIDIHVMFLIRHPLLRVRSVYDFERKQKSNTPGAIFAKNATFSEYVAWRMLSETPATIRDMQVKFLTSNGLLSGCNNHLDSAKEHVKLSQMVGVVEKFDQSMVVFEDYLGTENIHFNPVYVKQNITKNNDVSDEDRLDSLREDLGNKLFSTLLENNQSDLELYEFTTDLLNQRFSSLKNGQIRLDQLKNECEKLKK